MTSRVRPRIDIQGVFGIAVLLQLCGWTVGQESEHSRRSQIAAFTVEKYGATLFLPVTIDGVTGPFMLDSGASHHWLDQRFTPRLGKSITSERANTAGSIVTLSVFNPPKMLVGQITLESDRPVATHDFARLSEIAGRDVHGILGAPFFQRRVISFDFDRGIIRVLEEDESPESWGVAIPLRVDSTGHAYFLDANIGSEKMSFMLDTGMNVSISLAKSGFERLESRGLITSLRTSQIHAASGDIQRRSGRLESVRVGPFNHASLIVHESNANRIGLGFLSRYRATLDVPRHRLYLLRGDAYAATEEADKSGLHLSWKNKRVVAEIIDKHSPAQRAGIIKGDVVLDVNGTPATGMTLSQLRRTLRGKEGQECRVTILRGERQMTVRFSLQDYANWNRLNDNPKR